MANRDHKGAYISWRRMRQRLNHRPSYAHLDMDPRWDLFQNFLEDMGERPEGLTLERLDGAKGYWPWNCKWATMKEQCNNRRLRAPSNGSTGERFIYVCRDAFKVELCINRKAVHIAVCKTLEEARQIRDAAVEKHKHEIKQDPYPQIARTEEILS